MLYDICYKHTHYHWMDISVGALLIPEDAIAQYLQHIHQEQKSEDNVA